LVYDPLGRLFQTSGGCAGVTQFLHDGDALIGEYDSTGAMIRRYVHGTAEGVDDPLIACPLGPEGDEGPDLIKRNACHAAATLRLATKRTGAKCRKPPQKCSASSN
jgi:hypothetical protein